MSPSRALPAALLLSLAALVLPASAGVAAPPASLPGDAALSLAAGDQAAPALARGGNVVLAVWSDMRANPYGTYDYETSRDIYGMRFDLSGNPLDPSPIPICVAPAAQDSPLVSWNGTAFLVVFETYRLAGTGYYYQKGLAAVRVAPTGQVLDAAPIALHGLTPPAAGYWALASDGTNWVVVNEGSSASGDTLAVRVSPTGAVLDPPTRWLVKATYYTHSGLKLAYSGGVFLLTYCDAYVNGTYDTKAVRFDSSLNRLDAQPISLLPTPLGALAGDAAGFYIAWYRQEPDFSTVVAGSRVSTSGQRLDGNGVNLSGTRQPYAYATTAVAWDGLNWRVTWGEYATTYAARVSTAGQVLDPGSVPVPGLKTGPSAGTGGGGVQLVWTEYVNGNNDTVTARLSPSSTAGAVRPLSTAAPQQVRPDIAMAPGGALVVYRSVTASGSRVLAHPLDAAGAPLTSEPIVLEAATGSSGPGSPNVAWNGSAYLVTWANATGVVAQRLGLSGAKLDASPFLVMASPAFGPADVAAAGDTFLVTARRTGYTPEYIFALGARVRGSDGAVLDPSPLSLGGTYLRTAPAVTAMGGRFLVAYHSNWTHDESAADTAGIFVPVTGTPAQPFSLHGPFSTAGGNGIFEVGLASNGTTALLVQSQELTSGVENDLLARVIRADGTVEPLVNLTPWAGNQYRPRVAWDGTSYVIVYQEQKNRLAKWTLDQLDARSDIFGMRVSATGAVIDPQGFAISAGPLGETDPTVAALGGVSLVAASLFEAAPNVVSYRVGLVRLGAGGNRWPVAVATASPSAGDVPLGVGFGSGASTDLDGSLASFAWDFGDGGTSTAPNPSHTYTLPGPFVARLTVTDDDGASTGQALLVDARTPNLRPIAAATAVPASGPAPLDVVLYADGSYDPDGFVGNLQWTFDDGATYWGATAYHTFDTAGPHWAELTVYDSDGATGTATVPITVGAANLPPTAVAGATPTNGLAPLAVSFSSAGSSDPDGSIAAYSWSFGDGSSSTAANPSHTFAAAGTFTATLSVTDNRGATSAPAGVTITVTGASILRSTAISLTAVGKKSFTVTGKVTVKDGQGASVSGAAVSATWTLPTGATASQSATTDGAGVATFTTSGGRGVYTLTVNGIVKAGYTFDAAGSVLTKSIRK